MEGDVTDSYLKQRFPKGRADGDSFWVTASDILDVVARHDPEGLGEAKAICRAVAARSNRKGTQEEKERLVELIGATTSAVRRAVTADLRGYGKVPRYAGCVAHLNRSGTITKAALVAWGEAPLGKKRQAVRDVIYVHVERARRRSIFRESA